jgi:hypothetical protein
MAGIAAQVWSPPVAGHPARCEGVRLNDGMAPIRHEYPTTVTASNVQISFRHGEAG